MKRQIIFILIAVIIILSGCESLFYTTYETNNIEDYGQYIGNSDNTRPQKLLTEFMPESILPEYTNINYHYKACTSDTNACEVYLEFSIPSDEQFHSFLQEYGISPAECVSVDFSPGMKEFSYGSCFEISVYDAYTRIEYADLRKIFFDLNDKKIIFFALIVYDGGGTRTDLLNYFFKKFDISPEAVADHIFDMRT